MENFLAQATVDSKIYLIRMERLVIVYAIPVRIVDSPDNDLRPTDSLLEAAWALNPAPIAEKLVEDTAVCTDHCLVHLVARHLKLRFDIYQCFKSVCINEFCIIHTIHLRPLTTVGWIRLLTTILGEVRMSPWLCVLFNIKKFKGQ